MLFNPSQYDFAVEGSRCPGPGIRKKTLIDLLASTEAITDKLEFTNYWQLCC